MVSRSKIPINSSNSDNRLTIICWKICKDYKRKDFQNNQDFSFKDKKDSPDRSNCERRLRHQIFSDFSSDHGRYKPKLNTQQNCRIMFSCTKIMVMLSSSLFLHLWSVSFGFNVAIIFYSYFVHNAHIKLEYVECTPGDENNETPWPNLVSIVVAYHRYFS